MILAGLRGSLNSLLWALGLLHRVRFVYYSSVFYWDGLSSCTELDPAQSQSKSLSSLHSSFDHPANWTIINQKQEHVYSLSTLYAFNTYIYIIVTIVSLAECMLYGVIVWWQSWSCRSPLQQLSSTDTNVSCGFVEDTKEQDTKLTTPAIVLTTPDKVGALAMSHLWQCELPTILFLKSASNQTQNGEKAWKRGYVAWLLYA